MRKQAIIPLAIGLIVGLAALKLGWDYLAKVQGASKVPTGPVKKVVVAARPLDMGTLLAEKDLTVVDMPEDLVPADTTGDPKDFIGQSIKNAIAARMPVLKNMVGPGTGFRGVISEGYRAVTVKVNEYSGVAGLLKPGDRVDVVGTFSFRRGRGTQTVSKIVLQNVEVRAIGQEFHEREDGKSSLSGKLSRSVTMLVRPDQVERLQLAASKGKIRLALRGPFDDSSPMTQGITLAGLLSGPSDALGTNSGSTLLGKFFKMAFTKREPAAEVKQVEQQPIKRFRSSLVTG